MLTEGLAVLVWVSDGWLELSLYYDLSSMPKCAYSYLGDPWFCCCAHVNLFENIAIARVKELSI